MGIALLIALATFANSPQRAHESDMNGGIISGPGYAFILVAPDGWVLDFTSGRKEGVPVVLYKQGDSWSRARVVMYANPVMKTQGKTARGIIASDVTRYRKENPGIVVEDGDPIPVRNGQRLPVKVFRGTRFGDTELVAYADESSCVVMLVLSGAPNEVRAAQSSFAALLKTYLFVTSDVRH